MRRARIGVVLAGALILVATGCGGGEGGGGGGDDAGDLAAQVASIEALLDQIEALPTSATTAEEFSTELAPLRDQIQGLIEQVADASVPEELNSEKLQLGNELRGLRTQLGRVQALLANDDLEGAQAVTEQLLSINQIRQTIAAIEAATPSS
jgi:conjugal transfer/entry exclusion protein